MKVKRITKGYYKIITDTNKFEVSYEDMQGLWILEVVVDNSKYGMKDSLEHVGNLPTLKDCKQIINNLK